MNVNETCPDCGKSYVINSQDALKGCPHCSQGGADVSDETLEIRARLKVLLEKENREKELTIPQIQRNERPPSLWKKITSRLNK